MIARPLVLGVTLALLMAACGPGGPAAPPGPRTTIDLAYSDDPSREALLWGITSGKVTSPSVDVNVKFLPLGQIIPAANTKQFDAIEATPLAVARTAGGDPGFLILSNGLVGVSGTGLVVGKNSPIRAPGDLKGKTIGVASLAGTFVLEARYVLQKGHGLNTDLRTGEVKFSETPPEATAQLLADGRLDAAVLTQLARYRLESSPDHRTLLNVTQEFTRLAGQAVVNSVVVTYKDRVATKGAALAELQRMLEASRRYLTENRSAVLGEVAKKRGVDQAFLEWVFTTHELAAGPVTPAESARIVATWEAALAVKDIAAVPKIEDVLFRR